MKILNAEEAKGKINDYARNGQPFLFIIDSAMVRSVVLSPEEAGKEGIFFNFDGVSNRQEPDARPTGFSFDLFPVDFELYEKAFKKVMYHIQRGDTYLLNLAFRTPVVTSLSLEDLYNVSIAPFRLLFKDLFVVFSPEIFIRIKDGMISGFPMKGTIDAGIPGAERIILEDKKEFFEHNTIVDLIRNDIAMVAKKVRVGRFRYIDRLKTNRKELLQVSSEITGILPDDFLSRLGEILFTLLPAGSVTGAPKAKTVEIIRGTEPDDRGYYTGICGYFDGNSLDSAVMIRFIEKTDTGLAFRSGGGITARSEARNEFLEMIDKVYVPVI